MDWESSMINLDSADAESTLSSLDSFLETPPTSPLYIEDSDLTTPGSFVTEASTKGNSPLCKPFQSNKLKITPPGTTDAVGKIAQRKNIFFAAIKEKVIPLLRGTGSFNGIASFEKSEDITIQAYSRLDAQPRGLSALLKPYQLEGLSWLLYLRENGIGGILADDMGLGKTLQTLSLFQYLKDHENSTGHKFLVVCPLSVMDTWTAEISKWTTGLRVITYHGAAEQRAGLKREVRNQKKDSTIVITSYETLLQDISWFRNIYVWSYVVLDEGHRIKNSQSKRAQGLYKIRSEYKIVLTGTPIQNDLTELWSIFHWLYPELFVPETAEAFESAFSLSEGVFDHAFLEHVKQFLKLIMLRRTKEFLGEGLNIPPKNEIILSVPITDMQISWYWRILTGMDKELIIEGLGGSKKQLLLQEETTLAYGTQTFIDLDTSTWETSYDTHTNKRRKITTNILMELRKCSIHPYLIDDAMPICYDVGRHIIENSGKFIVLQKFIRQLVVSERRKIIIFSTFDQALNLCEDLLDMEKKDIEFRHVRIDGRTTNPWRKLYIHLFNNDPRYMVFLLSIRAGGEGLNLAAASTVIFLDEDWNPQIMRQAESRVHRLGQTRPVSIFRLQSKGTIEEQMCRRLSKKAYLATKLLDDTQSPSSPGSPTILDFPQDSTISLIPKASIHEDHSIERLLSSNLEKIIHSCAVSKLNIDEMAQIDKTAWLQRSERVRTNIFNGQQVDTRSRSFSIYKEAMIEASRASRRIGKQRTILIDGYPVCKEEFNQSQPEPTNEKSYSPDDKIEIIHHTACFLCQKDNPLECSICPRAFHWSCLEQIQALHLSDRGGIKCPHHYCCECGRSASQVGRLLYACIQCERAYCESCLGWDRIEFIGGSSEIHSYGYVPRNVFFIKCTCCVTNTQGKRESESDAICLAKRARRN